MIQDKINRKLSNRKVLTVCVAEDVQPCLGSHCFTTTGQIPLQNDCSGVVQLLQADSGKTDGTTELEIQKFLFLRE